ncbi:phosphotransferase [Myxococcota bacterium]|nr:phosphotransferase [Myxococcota bacterium]
MAVITALSAAQIDGIMRAYGMRALRIDPIAEGTTNTLYRLLTTRGRFVLRLTERAGEDDVRRELDVLRRLVGRQVPDVIPAAGGKPFIWAFNKPAVLFKELPGAVVPKATMSLTQLTAVGRWMAEAHAVEAPPELAPTLYDPASFWARHVSPVEEALRAAHPEVREAVGVYAPEGEVAGALDELPQAILHGDIFAENLLFHRDEGPWVVDFETAGRGPRLLDLAIAVFALAFDDARGAYELERVEALINGWSSLKRATPEEVERWALALRVATIRYAFTRARDFSLRPLTPELRGARDPNEALRQLTAQAPLWGMLAR